MAVKAWCVTLLQVEVAMALRQLLHLPLILIWLRSLCYLIYHLISILLDLVNVAADDLLELLSISGVEDVSLAAKHERTEPANLDAWERDVGP